MEANLFSITAIGVPLVVVPVTLVFGLRKALIAAVAVAVLLLIAPYVYFGIWALSAGEGIPETIKAVSLSLPALIVVAGWMLVWSAAYGAIAATVRLGWLRWRAVGS